VHISKLVTCVSEQTAKETIQYYKPKAKPKVVYNGVSIKEFQPASDPIARAELRKSLGASLDDTVLIFVGGEFARKGLVTVLEALKRLNNPHVKLWVFGQDPAIEDYRQTAEQMGIGQNVQFLGFFSDLPKMMRGGDIFVLPTYYEPFGLVVIEAMATGLPVITTRQAGVSELISHCENGFLLKSPDSAQELSQYITVLRNNPEQCRQIGEESLKTAATYTWDRMAEGIYALYCEALGRTPQTTASTS
jgi:UDP-glucose:(heptosyl)LPS alpha-1,3-glucosyltransferase